MHSAEQPNFGRHNFINLWHTTYRPKLLPQFKFISPHLILLHVITFLSPCGWSNLRTFIHMRDTLKLGNCTSIIHELYSNHHFCDITSNTTE